jgi:hypothetical protein
MNRKLELYRDVFNEGRASQHIKKAFGIQPEAIAMRAETFNHLLGVCESDQ